MLFQITNDLQLSTRPEGHVDRLPVPDSAAFRPSMATKGLAFRPLLTAVLDRREQERRQQRLQLLRELEELDRHQRNGYQYCTQLTPRLRVLAYSLFADRLKDPEGSKASKAFATGFMNALGVPVTRPEGHVHDQGV